MNGKLSINRLAMGSIRARKKQYVSLWIGIVLAVFFVSSLLLLAQCIYFSFQDRYQQRAGRQDAILRDAEQADPRQMLDSRYVTAVGSVYVIGEEATTGFAIGYYDDMAQDMLYRTLLEGRLPEKPGEIALEYGLLQKMRLDVPLGQPLTLTVRTPSGNAKFLPDTVKKTYTLVGILKPQDYEGYARYYSEAHYLQMPAALTARDEQVAPGGRPVVHRTVVLAPLVGLIAFEKVASEAWDAYNVLFTRYDVLDANPENMAAFLMTVAGSLGAALILAACMGIVNAFSASLNERRQQIGMMRAVGATSRQIRQIFGREALLMALVSTPVAIGLAWLMVRGITALTGGVIKFYSVWWFLPAALVLSFGVVILAAAAPLHRAAGVSPMQAIRETSLLRARKRLRVKPRQTFDVPALLASRHLRLYQSRQAGVSLLVALSMIIITFGWLGVRGTMHTTPAIYDYEINRPMFIGGGMIDDFPSQRLLSEADMAQVMGLPYVKQVRMLKQVNVNLLLDKVTPYLQTSSFNGYLIGDEKDVPPWWNRDHWAYERKEYDALRSAMNIHKELYTTTLTAMDDDSLKALQQRVIAGTIDLQAINEGREVLLVAPDTIYQNVEVTPDGNGVGIDSTTTPKEGQQYDHVYHNDVFRVGQEIDLLRLLPSGESEYAGRWMPKPETVRSALRNQRTVRIGAILRDGTGGLFGEIYGTGEMATSLSGLQALGMDDVGYHKVSLTLNRSPGEEARSFLHNTLADIALRGDNLQLTDTFQNAREQRQWTLVLFATLGALVLLFFALSLSMVNNALTNRIKSDRRAIGTLRAVGAPLGDILSSYRRQAYAMLGWGAGLGLMLSVAILLWMKWRNTYLPQGISIIWLVAAQALFLALLALVSALGLRGRLRQVTRASIVDNIREL